MIPAAFDYHVPSTLEEAIGLLQKHGEEAKVLSRGQSLLPLLKLRLGFATQLVTVTNTSPPALLQDLITAVVDVNIANGISNSLDAKLDAALEALSDSNANNDIAAINAMEAFISAVQAQSGKKIPAADASTLITLAQAIIDSLSG